MVRTSKPPWSSIRDGEELADAARGQAHAAHALGGEVAGLAPAQGRPRLMPSAMTTIENALPRCAA